MVDGDPTGTIWTDQENDLIVADYFNMLGQELAHEPYSKTQHFTEIQRLTRRTKGSIERKHQNISAVLRKLGLPWIFGYKPLVNYQNALIAAIERHLSLGGVPSFAGETAASGIAEASGLYLSPAPSLQQVTELETPALRHLITKFDPAARDARNRVLGKRGEELALAFEQARLRDAGRSDLARKVDWIAESQGDGAGFDILSFTESGEERLLEVKTTTGYAQTPFFLSANEHMLSEERPKHFRIFRLYDFAREPKAFEIAPPLSEALHLRTASYRASFS
ncbi:MAG TPA: DUF3883 domain-containing protein [Rhizomicrobium sp.]|jgi:hypothetical protein